MVFLFFCSYTVEYFSPDLQTGWIKATHHVADTQVTVRLTSQFHLFPVTNLASLQITELAPGAMYVFLVRAENSQGISVPSGLSNAIKTIGEDFDAASANDLSAARTLLTGKVSYNMRFLIGS